MKWFVFVGTWLWAATAWAGGFAKPEGTLWTKVDYSSWRADGKFAGIFDRDEAGGVDLGDEIAFDPSTGGRLDTVSVALTVLFVPVSRFTLGAYLPVFQRVVFEDDTFVSETTGVGDLRPSVGVQLTPEASRVGTTLSIDSKIPLSTLPEGFETIPLSEGQFDIAVRHETSWMPIDRLTISVMTLFRRRTVFVDGERRIKPGDEAELGARIGGAPFHGLWLSLGVHGLWSTGSEDRSGRGAVTLRDRRQVQHLVAGAYLRFGRWLPESLRGLAVDTSLRVPFHGQDYPVGMQWSAGLAYEVDLY